MEYPQKEVFHRNWGSIKHLDMQYFYPDPIYSILGARPSIDVRVEFLALLYLYYRHAEKRGNLRSYL